MTTQHGPMTRDQEISNLQRELDVQKRRVAYLEARQPTYGPGPGSYGESRDYNTLILPLPSTQANCTSTFKISLVTLSIALESYLKTLHETAPFFDLSEHDSDARRMFRTCENLMLGCHVDYPRDLPSWHDAERAKERRAEMLKNEAAARAARMAGA